MARTLTAMVSTPGVTVCTQDGTPYRPDTSGIVHVEAKHVAELTTRGNHSAVSGEVGATAHKGTPLQLTVENG